MNATCTSTSQNNNQTSEKKHPNRMQQCDTQNAPHTSSHHDSNNAKLELQAINDGQHDGQHNRSIDERVAPLHITTHTRQCATVSIPRSTCCCGFSFDHSPSPLGNDRFPTPPEEIARAVSNHTISANHPAGEGCAIVMLKLPFHTNLLWLSNEFTAIRFCHWFFSPNQNILFW